MTALPEHVFRTVAETSRCDHIYGEQMRVVRSRVSERLGNDLYKKTISDEPLTDPKELDKVCSQRPSRPSYPQVLD